MASAGSRQSAGLYNTARHRPRKLPGAYRRSKILVPLDAVVSHSVPGFSALLARPDPASPRFHCRFRVRPGASAPARCHPLRPAGAAGRVAGIAGRLRHHDQGPARLLPGAVGRHADADRPQAGHQRIQPCTLEQPVEHQCNRGGADASGGAAGGAGRHFRAVQVAAQGLGRLARGRLQHGQAAHRAAGGRSRWCGRRRAR